MADAGIFCFIIFNIVLGWNWRFLHFGKMPNRIKFGGKIFLAFSKLLITRYLRTTQIALQLLGIEFILPSTFQIYNRITCNASGVGDWQEIHLRHQLPCMRFFSSIPAGECNNVTTDVNLWGRCSQKYWIPAGDGIISDIIPPSARVNKECKMETHFYDADPPARTHGLTRLCRN